MSGQKVITRLVLLLSIVSLFTDIASEMLYPVMPVYLSSIGFSVVLIGILEGLAEATAGLSKGYFGQLSDRKGLRLPFIRWGYGLSAISKPMMAVLVFPLWIFLARTIDRLGKGIRTSARDALLSDEATPETKGKVFGFHRALDTAGAAAGPLIALAFLAFFPGEYRWLFVLAFIPGIAAVSITFALKEKYREQKPVTRRTSFFSYFSYWKRSSPQYKKLVAGLMAFTLFNSSDAFLLLSVKENLGSDTLMIGYYVFYNLMYAAFSYPMGLLADRLGLKTVLITGLLIFSVTYFFFGMAENYLHYGLLFFLYSIYAASTEGISKALISNLAEPTETATAIGFFNSMSSVCALVASTFAGIIWYTFSASAMFMVSGLGVGLVAIYLVFSLMHNKMT
ncbi:MAG: MFS transporter [Bacteroidales bacterium]